MKRSVNDIIYMDIQCQIWCNNLEEVDLTWRRFQWEIVSEQGNEYYPVCSDLKKYRAPCSVPCVAAPAASDYYTCDDVIANVTYGFVLCRILHWNPGRCFVVYSVTCRSVFWFLNFRPHLPRIYFFLFLRSILLLTFRYCLLRSCKVAYFNFNFCVICLSVLVIFISNLF